MDGWMEGGCMDGWMEGGRKDGGRKDGWREDGWRDGGRMDGWMDGGRTTTTGRMNRRIDGLDYILDWIEGADEFDWN